MFNIGEDIIYKLEGAIDSANKVNERVDERLSEIDSQYWANYKNHEIRDMFEKHLRELENIRQEIYEGFY
ncbi:hypothetical protein [Halobacillus seohaensis]|uniref:Uncharacterized protein n=1 Tax=Halobacillus seohaensis TaxID=447421 RepID=A0ABW2EP23_9BACI